MSEPVKSINVESGSDTAAAIQAGVALGKPNTNPHQHGKSYAIVPEGCTLEYLHQPEAPPRKAGTVKLTDVASFCEYWSRQAEQTSYVYGAIQPAQFVAVFNEHGATPGWRDHRAVFTLTHSKEWELWMKHNRQPFDGNEAFAMWLEDNLVDIIDPDPAKFMDIALNFRVRQGQTFGKAIRLQDGNIDFTYTNTVEGGAQNEAGKLTVPEEITISIPVWSGLNAESYRVKARFRYKLVSGALQIRYELIRPHKVVEQAFAHTLDNIERLTKAKVLFGSPE